MDALALFYLSPFDAALLGGPWRGGELALLGLLPGAALHRHPALRLAGAWMGFSLAILCHAIAVGWLLGPGAMGFPFDVPFGEAHDAVLAGFFAATVLPILGYWAVGALLTERAPHLIDDEEAHLRGLWTRARAWAAGGPPLFNRKGNGHVG